MYLLEPEVPGGIGNNSKLLYENGRIKQAIHLHYEFEGWLGDDLITTSPFFLVTEGIANAIKESDLQGYSFKDIEISTSYSFKELHPNRVLPRFQLLIPVGVIEVEGKYITSWTGHDFCMKSRIDLVISEKAFELFRKYNINNCDITELEFKA